MLIMLIEKRASDIMTQIKLGHTYWSDREYLQLASCAEASFLKHFYLKKMAPNFPVFLRENSYQCLVRSLSFGGSSNLRFIFRPCAYLTHHFFFLPLVTNRLVMPVLGAVKLIF